ncbi:type II toxin-antitoxin system ParD family antitoxin [Brevundimonas sp.]|uniref:type II toxin-antitoxin system ParD family antitoxin n=1 Tax=Brevundimonas sp. TaxID=1871086 RepID=UPI002ABC4815|nr:type II toxin-antitoxin system ParD family antitoxin [Brevundimonas sp.]MDZ4362729.1 type II toxin-antitoxin system ParD family antitoxin [Brevundimonas sp.]
MTMTVELGALEAVVKDLVAHGRFGSKSEVLREGVRLVQEREVRLAELMAKLQVGIDDADAGRMTPIDEVEIEVLADLKRRAELQ